MPKQKSYELATDNWINKSNVLNEVRNNRMSISQIRLFSVYLSKINPKNIKSREVTFKLEEYTKIMQFKQTNTTRLIKTAEDLLGLTVKYWDKTGEYSSDGHVGFVMCQIFKRFKLDKNDADEWVVTIDCHDDVLHLMFDLQKYYFKYQLWNALQLTSPNQQRMYEILKQYENVGERVVTVKDLRELLGIKPEEYPRWNNFKIRVLDASQIAMEQYTDIKFTWEVSGKRGQGGKINALKFKIEKNNGYIRQLTLEDYLTEQEQVELESEPEEFERPDDEAAPDGEYSINSKYRERIEFFMDACNNEFSFEQVEELNNILKENTSVKLSDEKACYNYIYRRYVKMDLQDKQTKGTDTKVKSRFGLLKFFIRKNIEV